MEAGGFTGILRTNAIVGGKLLAHAAKMGDARRERRNLVAGFDRRSLDRHWILLRFFRR